MESGYRVLRSDTDVYLAEDPYPILRGPLFSRFQMVAQHDFFGAKERDPFHPLFFPLQSSTPPYTPDTTPTRSTPWLPSSSMLGK